MPASGYATSRLTILTVAHLTKFLIRMGDFAATRDKYQGKKCGPTSMNAQKLKNALKKAYKFSITNIPWITNLNKYCLSILDFYVGFLNASLILSTCTNEQGQILIRTMLEKKFKNEKKNWWPIFSDAWKRPFFNKA